MRATVPDSGQGHATSPHTIEHRRYPEPDRLWVAFAAPEVRRANHRAAPSGDALRAAAKRSWNPAGRASHQLLTPAGPVTSAARQPFDPRASAAGRVERSRQVRAWSLRASFSPPLGALRQPVRSWTRSGPL